MALAGTEELNPGLECREGQLYYNNKPLTAHKEGLQLFFKTTGCTSGLQHYRLLTCHAVSNGSNMECSICLKQERFMSEQHMSQAMQAAGLDEHMVMQYQPNWWHGRVDYYFPTAQVVVQVDGPAHFVANPKTWRLAELVHTDLRCNVQAWVSAVKMMRVHHDDQYNPVWQVQLAAMVLKQGPLLVLLPSFAGVNWQHPHTGDISWNYVHCMQLLLEGCTHSCGPDGYHWYCPPTL